MVIDTVIQKQLNRFIDQLRDDGEIPTVLALPGGTEVALGHSPTVLVRLNTWNAARHLINPTMETLGAAYVEGEIDIEGPIRDVIRVATSFARAGDRNQGLGKLPEWIAKHSRRSDKQAIEYHYDVSNEFYSLWLDPSMVYSCAYFRDGDEDLATAQMRKLEHICRKLVIEPEMRMLDIGCGWGALAIHAARHHGARVLGITLSDNQYLLATERVREAGLEDRIEIRIQDYRDVEPGAGFDRISSVGMFEHVGLKNLPEYFRVVHDLLKPGGVTLNHGITSVDVDNRSVGLGAGDFINRYVFPDGELPHVSLAIRELSAAGLELTDAESLRRHYARTLWAWSEAFEGNIEELSRIAGERKTRIWRVYLAGCAQAFAYNWLNIYQLQAVRPKLEGSTMTSPLPMSRGYMYAR
ncbi:MAG: class I SAM-dependent methyltransferase [Burkholderiaceae bacterium]|nr:class I SAM-dependent methyltransferase [Burkholderiaceae bacterium]